MAAHNGGEIFEADFLVHLEHGLAQARLERPFDSGWVSRTKQRVIRKMDKNRSRDESALQPYSHQKAREPDASIALWFDPIDDQQRFLDFFCADS